MSRLRNERAHKKISKIKPKMESFIKSLCFSELMTLLWSVGRIQARNDKSDAKNIIVFPAGADDASVSNPLAIHAWEIESLINLKILLGDTQSCSSDVLNFRYAGHLVNLLRKYEDMDIGRKLDGRNVRAELHRIAHRQFPFQAGFANIPAFYRSVYIFGGQNGREYFKAKFGIDINDYIKCGFALYAYYINRHIIKDFLDTRSIKIPLHHVEKTLDLLSRDVHDMHIEYKNMLKMDLASVNDLAYRPSILRRYPIVALGKVLKDYYCPIPDLITYKISLGLYYNFINSGHQIRDEIARRFESYCYDLLVNSISDLKVETEFSYSGLRKSNNYNSPDLIVKKDRTIKGVFEVKSTKLTYGAQYSLDPIADANEKYRELSKAVYQLWRFVSHSRQGFIPTKIDNKCALVVLTLDNWLYMSSDLTQKVLKMARDLFKSDDCIEDIDMRPIVFASIEDFERVCSRCDGDQFFALLEIASKTENAGWMLSSIFDNNFDSQKTNNGYPFSLSELLPWWGSWRSEQ